jgi:hypothetical protein
MPRFQWSALNKQQVGAFAEYFVKMEFTMYGFQVYGTEVDDRGIDFVARHESGPFIEVQVKCLRQFGYVFMRKDKFHLKEELYLALALLTDGVEPELYLIPSLTWSRDNGIFVNRDYENRKSKPEWGINVSAKNLLALQAYRFENSIQCLVDKTAN